MKKELSGVSSGAGAAATLLRTRKSPANHPGVATVALDHARQRFDASPEGIRRTYRNAADPGTMLKFAFLENAQEFVIGATALKDRAGLLGSGFVFEKIESRQQGLGLNSLGQMAMVNRHGEEIRAAYDLLTPPDRGDLHARLRAATWGSQLLTLLPPAPR